MITMSAEEWLCTQLVTDEIDRVVLAVDKDNRIIFINSYATQALGLERSSTPSELKAVFGVDDLYRFLEASSFNFHWRGRLTVRTPAGGQVDMAVRSRFIPGDKCVFNKILIVGEFQVSPVPDHRQTAARPDITEEQYRKLHEISSTINSNLDFQGICAEITMKAAELIGADRSLLYSVEDTKIGVLATWNMTDEERSLFRMVDMEHGVIKNCLRNMAPVLVPEYKEHPDWIPEIYEELKFSSFILYPLLAQKQLVGVLALFGNRPMQFTDKDIMLLQLIANQMAIAVLNAQVYSEIRNMNRNLEREVNLKVNELQVSELQLLRKTNEQEAVFNSITDSLVVVDDSLRIVDINQAAMSHYGIRDKKQVAAKKYCDIICQRRYCKSGGAVCTMLHRDGGHCGECLISQTICSGKPGSGDIDIADRVFAISVYPIFDESQRVQKVVCFLRDITLLKKRSGELMQSQKMQAVGQLAAGVAHEIRNPLGAISNYVYIVENWLEEIESQGFAVEPDIKNSFTAIKKLVERSETVIRGLLDFSREKPSEITLFPLQDVVDQVLLLVGKTAQKKKVDIAVEGNPQIKVKSNSSALQHIIFNLAVNAIDALPNGGRVTMAYKTEGDCIVLAVMDNGEGIRREDLDKIYNPFYTTKAPNRGTGLGLYIVYNLVNELNGRIEVESSPGVLTKFTVTLPQ